MPTVSDAVALYRDTVEAVATDGPERTFEVLEQADPKLLAMVVTLLAANDR